MKVQERKPFLLTRAFRVSVEIAILALIAVRMFLGNEMQLCCSVIFALAAIENFIGATDYFSREKRVRGNICAILCMVFLLAALWLLIHYLGFL